MGNCATNALDVLHVTMLQPSVHWNVNVVMTRQMEPAEEIFVPQTFFGELSPSLVHMKDWKNDFPVVKLVDRSHILESQSDVDMSEVAENGSIDDHTSNPN
uniref:Uncharacterized protein n=1 Tax=Ditylenchus dipsaci TaxID=166011 RepID=A0A915CZ05_9BILA